jgi:hypothetical protein
MSNIFAGMGLKPVLGKAREVGRLTLIALLLVLFAVPNFPQKLGTQTQPCTVGVRAAAFGFWTWAPAVRVKVYIIESDFRTDEIPYLLTSLRNWDSVSQLTGSGVRLDYIGPASEVVHCQNCLTILRAPIFNQTARHGGEFHAYSEQGNQIVTSAEVFIDPGITNPEALTTALAHELGHGFGLLDCYGCKNHSTVMNKLKSMNYAKGLEGPTSCDVEQVRNAYQELRTRVGPTPVLRDVTPDEGEEPSEPPA